MNLFDMGMLMAYAMIIFFYGFYAGSQSFRRR